MHSSTAIVIRCPSLSEEQKDELFQILEECDPEWIKRELFSIRNIGDDVEISLFECGTDFDDAEDIAGSVLEDFFEKYFIGKDCSVHVRFAYMNTEGTFEWNIYCKDGVQTCEEVSEIYDASFQCLDCYNSFEVEFDYEDEERPYSTKEEEIVCPHCGEKYIRIGNYMHDRETSPWKEE